MPHKTNTKKHKFFFLQKNRYNEYTECILLSEK